VLTSDDTQEINANSGLVLQNSRLNTSQLTLPRCFS